MLESNRMTKSAYNVCMILIAEGEYCIAEATAHIVSKLQTVLPQSSNSASTACTN